MATSKTVIANMALSHLKISKEIGNLDSEKSETANACRRFFDSSRDKVLRDFNWPFATKIESLVKLEDDPNDEWCFSYRYPSDCLKFRRLLSGIRNDNRQSRASYRVAKDDSGLVIFCDLDLAQAEYTEKVEAVELYPADFVLALSYLLAKYVAPRITGGDPFNLGDKALKEYLAEIANARSNAFNEEQPDEEVESELVRERY